MVLGKSTNKGSGVKQKMLRLTLVMLASVLLAGCGQVWTPQPLPRATLSAEEQARFAGTWVLQVDEGAPYMVAFDQSGAAHIAVVDWKDDHFTLRQSMVVIAMGKHSDGKSGFLSIPNKETGRPSGYPFARYSFVSPNDLVIWWPDPAPFAAAIRAGRLKGTTNKDGSLEITAAPQEVLEFLDDPGNPPLFAYDKPYLFRKVAGANRRGQSAASGPVREFSLAAPTRSAPQRPK